jgi:hypothetical protein
MASQVVVIKYTMYAKASSSLGNSHYLADAFDAYLRSTLIRGRKKNFNPNAGPDRRTSTAEDQGSVQGNIVCEASFSAFGTVVPVKNNREPKLVSNCGSTLHRVLVCLHRVLVYLHRVLFYWEEAHTQIQSSVLQFELQATGRLKSRKSEVSAAWV